MRQAHNPKLTTIYVVRHGQSEYNVQKRLSGHDDPVLTQQGEAQAHALAEEFKHIHFDEVFSSDLLRAKRTAEIVVLERKLAVKTAQALREQSFGVYEGASYEKFETELQALFAKYQKLSDEQKFEFQLGHNIETHESAVTRFIMFLREVSVAHPGKTILIVGHGSIIRYFLVKLGFGTFTTLPVYAVSNLAFVKIESDGADFLIKETKGIITVESTAS